MLGISNAPQAIQLRLPVSHKGFENWPDVLMAAGYVVSVQASHEDLHEAERELGTVANRLGSTDSLRITACRHLSAHTILLVGSEVRFPVSRHFLAIGLQFEDVVAPDVALSVFKIAFTDELIDVISRHCFALTPDNAGAARDEHVERIFARKPGLLLPAKMRRSSRLKGHFGGSDGFGWYVAVSQKGACWNTWKSSSEYSALVAELAGIGGEEVDILKL